MLKVKHACFARNFGFPYCPCNALCSARLNDFTGQSVKVNGYSKHRKKWLK